MESLGLLEVFSRWSGGVEVEGRKVVEVQGREVLEVEEMEVLKVQGREVVQVALPTTLGLLPTILWFLLTTLLVFLLSLAVALLLLRLCSGAPFTFSLTSFTSAPSFPPSYASVLRKDASGLPSYSQACGAEGQHYHTNPS